MICYCGNNSFSSSQHDYFHVAATGDTYKAGEKMQIESCSSCGVIRQSNFSAMDDNSYKRYYELYPPSTEEYFVKNREHDRVVAKTRANNYFLTPGSDVVVLDVGCGSGAFVEECLSRNIRAYGCEIAKYHSTYEYNIYIQRFEDIHFPTDSFDVVTCHDVFEHVLNPLSFMQELHRVLKQNGTLFLEIPNFFCSEGEKHWKKEHVYYFRPEDIKRLATLVGFVFEEDWCSSPIPSKHLFRLIKKEEKRVTILVPPGIGDSYWSIVKLESFLKHKNLGMPDVSVVCPRSKRHNGHQRAFPFLELFPFLHASWDAVDSQDAVHKRIWQEAYSQEGRTIFEKVLGYDYFISYNGHLRVGKELADIDPHLECNWFPDMFVSLEQKAFEGFCKQRYGKYIVFYFIFQGTYCYWTQQFSLQSVIDSVKRICEASDCVPVFVGGAWDAEDTSLSQVIRSVKSAVNLVGKTSIQQLFGLLHGAEMTIGYPSGLTIMSAAMRLKTLVIWNDYYHREFFHRAMPPGVRNTTYFAEHTFELTPTILQRKTEQILSGASPSFRPLPEGITIVTPAAVKRNNPLPKVPYKGAKVSSVAFLCVLKSGGDFTEDYVHRLIGSVRRNTYADNVEYYCLTDLPIKSDQFTTVPLKNNYSGWWSKVEIFRPGITKADLCVYFDLDTVVMDDITDLISHRVSSTSFMALSPWNERNRAAGEFASGIMRWETKLYHFLHEEYPKHAKKNSFTGDQQYFSHVMNQMHYPWEPLQKYFGGIYSFKRCMRTGTLLRDTKIVCFHGKPRPHEVEYPWMKEHWRR